uniref:Uncharacterized protein n=1 Tax=Echeneis naucrates TaxID=173247 RepID=A0A665X088_ECHNA
QGYYCGIFFPAWKYSIRYIVIYTLATSGTGQVAIIDGKDIIRVSTSVSYLCICPRRERCPLLSIHL